MGGREKSTEGMILGAVMEMENRRRTLLCAPPDWSCATGGHWMALWTKCVDQSPITNEEERWYTIWSDILTTQDPRGSIACGNLG